MGAQAPTQELTCIWLLVSSGHGSHQAIHRTRAARVFNIGHQFRLVFKHKEIGLRGHFDLLQQALASIPGAEKAWMGPWADHVPARHGVSLFGICHRVCTHRLYPRPLFPKTTPIRVCAQKARSSSWHHCLTPSNFRALGKRQSSFWSIPKSHPNRSPNIE